MVHTVQHRVSLCHPIFITLSTLATYPSVEHTGNSIDFFPMAAVAVSRFGSPHHEGIPDYLAHRSRARSDSFHVTVGRESTLRNPINLLHVYMEHKG